MNHKHYKINKEGRDFVMGDLHGCYDLLEKKLEELKFNYVKDRLFSVGDFIDRGPDSLKCLNLIDQLWFHPVLGNHEDMMLMSVLYAQGVNMWLQNGGEWILDVLDDNYKQMMCHKLEKLPITITIETKNGPVGICHAEPPTPRWKDVEHPTQHDIQNMLWGRRRVKNRIELNVQDVYMTYHGHTPVVEPLKLGNAIFIDTGAHYSGILTIVEIN